MTKLVLKTLEKSYGENLFNVIRWQELNDDVLSLCPSRWDTLSANHKWALIRILSRRDGYVPDWISPDIWSSLKSQLMHVSFEDETDLLEMESPGESPEERDYKQIMSGKAPQSFREGP